MRRFLLVAVMIATSALIAGDPAECRAKCEADADAFLKSCILNGGKDCERQAEEMRMACVAACEEPPPPPCEESCRLHAEQVYEDCIASGVVAERCQAKMEEAFNDCLRDRCNLLPPEPCEAECEAKAQEVLKACLANGGDEASCKERYRHALEDCLKQCGQEPPPPPPPCEERCGQHAKEIYNQCVAAGGNEQDCKLKYERTLEDCLKQCGQEPPPEQRCDQICAEKAREALRRCLENGGDEQRCHQLLEQVYRECLSGCNGGPPAEPFVLAVSSGRISQCSAGTILVKLTNRASVQAFSFGVTHDPAVVTLTRIDFGNCPALAALNGGAGPHFFEADIDAGTAGCNREGIAGGTVYAIMSEREPSTVTIPPSREEPIVRLTYEAAPEGAAGAVSQLEIVGCLGDDLPWPAVLTVDFQSVEPAVKAGAVGLTDTPCLLVRGDTNNDGKRDISDAVTILGYLFEHGAGPLRCEDAADINDDGRLDVADPIYLLFHFFRSGAPVPEPRDACGADTTPDTLTCEAYPPCM